MSYIKTQIIALSKIEIFSKKRKKIAIQLANISPEINKLDNKFKKLKNELKSEKIIYKKLKNKYNEAEKKIEEYLSNINKSKIKLGQVKSNKEYQYITKEINSLNKKEDEIEDLMIECLEEIDIFEKSINKKSKIVATQQKLFFEKKIKILNQELENIILAKKINKEIIKTRKIINPDLISMFDLLNKKMDRLSIAAVRNSICMGCNMCIPPQLFNDLQRFDEIKFCPHCKKIVYWDSKKNYWEI